MRHNLSYTPEYRVWLAIKTRCYSKNHDKYHRYGGRGIKMCDRWHDFANFYSDMGPKPSPKHEIERMNNDADYCQDNCKWATRAEQNRNHSRNVKINGSCLTDVAEENGLHPQTLRNRLNSGQSLDEALNKPVKQLVKRFDFQGESRTLQEIAEMTGISYTCLKKRLYKGMNIEEATTHPSRRKKRSA